jgi:Uncharacterized protein with SCP/PR1 domains
MYCGINIVRRSYGLHVVRGSKPLNRSSILKADAVRRCGFSHTPCGMSFTRTFQKAGYLPARAYGENLAWGQGELGSPVHTLQLWLELAAASQEPPRDSWRDLGIAYERGTCSAATAWPSGSCSSAGAAKFSPQSRKQLD